MSVEQPSKSILRSIRRGLASSAFATLVAQGLAFGTGALTPMPAIAQNSEVSSSALTRFPPIDLFVYADQSGSVYDRVNGTTPAAQLSQMVIDVIDSPLSAASDRTVLDGNGRFYLYGFGENQPLSEQANSCDDDVTALAEGLTSSSRGDIDAALQVYAGRDPNNNATNFTCLFQHIANNQAIAAAQNDGRQAVVLIASDFLHDPFDQSEISLADGGDAGLVRSGVYVANEGICDLEDIYTSGNLPTELAAGVSETVNAGNTGLYSPLYTFLELKLSSSNFRIENSPYAQCAITTSRDGLLTNVLQPLLRAERFSFEDADSFGPQFARTVINRLAPPLGIVSTSINQLGDNAIEVTATVNNPTGRTVSVTSLGVSFQGSLIQTTIPNGPVSIAPDRQVVLGPLLVENTSIGAATEVILSVSYDLDSGGEAQSTNPLTVQVNQSMPLTASIDTVLMPPNDPASFTLTLTNQLDTPLSISSIFAGSTAPTYQLDVPGTLNALSGQTSRSLSLTVPEEARPDLEAGVLSLFIEARPNTGSATSRIAIDLAIPAPDAALPPNVTSTTLQYLNGEDQRPTLQVILNNPNPFNISIDSLIFANSNGVQLGELDRLTNDQRIVGPNTQKTINLQIEILRDQGLFDPILREMRNSIEVLISATAEGLPAGAPSPLDISYQVAPEISCPDVRRPESYAWTLPEGTSGLLELTLRHGHPTAIMPPIESYRIRGAGQEVISTDQWQRVLWSQESNGSQTARVRIPFNTDAMRKLRYETLENLSVQLFSGANTAICNPEISIPARPSDDVLPLTIPDNSWALEGENGDQILRFRVVNENRTSLLRLDEVRLVDGDASDRGVALRDEVTFANGALNGSEDAYVSPGGEGRIVRINLARLNHDEESIRAIWIRLITIHDGNQATPPFRPVLPADSIEISRSSWNIGSPELTLTITADIPYRTERVLITGQQDRTPPQSMPSNAFSVPIEGEFGGLDGLRPATITVALPFALQQNQQGLLGLDNLFACVPIGNAGDCEGWERLPPMPPSNLITEVQDFGQNGIAYDTSDQTLKFLVRNEGPYLDTITGIRFSAADDVDRSMSLARSVPLAPGLSWSDPVALDELTQAYLVNVVEFFFSMETRQGSNSPRAEGIADPPRIRLENVETRTTDWVIGFLVDVCDFFLPTTCTEQKPLAIATVKVERVFGSLADYQVRLGQGSTENSFILNMSHSESIPNTVGNANALTAFERTIIMEIQDPTIPLETAFLGQLFSPVGTDPIDTDRQEFLLTNSPEPMSIFFYVIFAFCLVVLVYLIWLYGVVPQYTWVDYVVKALFSKFAAIIILPIISNIFGSVTGVISGIFTTILIGVAALGASAVIYVISTWVHGKTQFLYKLKGYSNSAILVTPHQVVQSDVRKTLLILTTFAFAISILLYYLLPSSLNMPDYCSAHYDIRIGAPGGCE